MRSCTFKLIILKVCNEYTVQCSKSWQRGDSWKIPDLVKISTIYRRSHKKIKSQYEKNTSAKENISNVFWLDLSRPIIIIVIFSSRKKRFKGIFLFLYLLSNTSKLLLGRFVQLPHIQGQKSKVACLKSDD